MQKFIQTLLTMLSKANREIISLKKHNSMLAAWLIDERRSHREARNKVDDLTEENIALKRKLTEWQKAFEIRDGFWSERFYAQQEADSQMALLMKNVLHDQLEEAWYSETNEKYRNAYLGPKDTDEEYADWALTNNWMKLDDAAYFFVCGAMPDDKQYEEWVETQLAN